jgi:hypothetical protein
LLRTPWRNPLIESAFQIGTFDPSVTTRPAGTRRPTVEIQAAMGESNEALPADKRIDLHIGINIGDTET